MNHLILQSCHSLLQHFIMGSLSLFSRVIISILKIPSKTGLVLLRKDWKKWKKVTCQLQSYTWRLLFYRNPTMQRYSVTRVPFTWGLPFACNDGTIWGSKPLLVIASFRTENRLNANGGFGMVKALKLIKVSSSYDENLFLKYSVSKLSFKSIQKRQYFKPFLLFPMLSVF